MPLQGCRNQYLVLETPESLFRHVIGTGETSYCAVLLLPRLQCRDIEPVMLIQRRTMILYSHHPRASSMKQPGADATHIAKTLHRNPALRHGESHFFRNVTAGDKHAAPGRLYPPQRSAEVDRFPRHHAGRGCSGVA